MFPDDDSPLPPSPNGIPLPQAAVLRRQDPYSCIYGRAAPPPAEENDAAAEEHEEAPGALGAEAELSTRGGLFWNRMTGAERRKALVDGFASLFRSFERAEGTRSSGFGAKDEEAAQETVEDVKEAVQPETEQAEEPREPEHQHVQPPEVSAEPAAEDSPIATAVTDPEPEMPLPSVWVTLEEQGAVVDAAEEEEEILEEAGLESPSIAVIEGVEVDYEEDLRAKAEASGGQETGPSAASRSFLDATLTLQAQIGGALSPELAIAAAAAAVSFVLAAGCAALGVRLLRSSSGPAAPAPEDETVEEVGKAPPAPAAFPATPAAAAAAKVSSSPLSPTQLMARALATPLNAIASTAASAARGAAPRSVFVSASSRLTRTGSKENRVRFNVEFDDSPPAPKAAPGQQAKNSKRPQMLRLCSCCRFDSDTPLFLCIALPPKQSRPTMPGRPPHAVRPASPRPEAPLPAPEKRGPVVLGSRP